MKEKISISENGIVFVPSNVQMNTTEITSLFETTQAIIRKCIKQIQKQTVIQYNETSSLVVEGDRIVCDYYDLEMLVAISFQVQSIKAKQFRKWVLQRLVAPLGCQSFELELQNWKDICLNQLKNNFFYICLQKNRKRIKRQTQALKGALSQELVCLIYSAFCKI